MAFALLVKDQPVSIVHYELHQQIPQQQQIKEHKFMQSLFCSTYLKQQCTLTTDKTLSALYAVYVNMYTSGLDVCNYTIASVNTTLDTKEI
jgi:hypothetical protein